MKYYIFFLFLLADFSSLAQIKEINFLGKKWYLHGIDMRVKGRLYHPDFYKKMVSEADYPSQDYKNDLHGGIKSVNYDYVSAINTLAIGAVFRPFTQSKWKYIRQIEFAHNLELERVNMSLTYAGFHNNDAVVRLRTVDLGYNPRLMLSSPTVAQYLKFYASADGYIYAPLSGMVYTSPERKYLPNGSGGYEKNKEYYSDRINTSHFKYGGGISAGVKMNIDCNWNFHLAYSVFDVYTYHGTSKITSVSGNNGVQFGLRYKFGIPDNDQGGADKPPVFW